MRRELLTWLLLPLALMVAAVPLAWGDDDDDEHSRDRGTSSPPGVAPVANAAYAEECGSCHFAYPPGLLPAPSWERVMGQLDDHFGDDASLSDGARDELQGYLVANAADRSPHRLSRSIARATAAAPPLRITDIPHLKHEHGEIPSRLVTDDPEIRSFSRCPACHTRAPEGSFREGEIRIPGRGRWDD